ncbi:Hsp20/alpha crystallin family protein [Fuchsiella alkaliacetigena]|uniref:Hsp20/alpha crystallin family protein n=1 Tax=Fuchsiella alkaliacetigena TaxID=957042 RepID=UPI00200B7CEB|nr:Hsp20/alpha crystallin family protein [Fuchsiella alkaliacetigena]MCK8823767.1 Hsp20/alpha crystallin family protein [Fuchsiella alkaliacetigena]
MKEQTEDFNVQNNPLNYSTGIPTCNQQDYCTPQIDILEDQSNVYYVCELPGVEPESLNVELTTESIFIQGELGAVIEENQKRADFVYQERAKGGFFREISLPVNVDVERAEANFKRGLLEISLPKVNNY